MNPWQAGDIALYNEFKVRVIHPFQKGEYGVFGSDHCVIQYLNNKHGIRYSKCNYGFDSPPNCHWVYSCWLTPAPLTKRGNPASIDFKKD